MNTQQIINFIKEELEKGAPRAEIERVLKVNQIDQSEIEQAFAAVGDLRVSPPTGEDAAPEPPQPPMEPLTPPPPVRPINPPRTMPPLMANDYEPAVGVKKSRGGLVALVIVLLLLVGAVGAGAYVYLYQPELIDKMLGFDPLPVLEEEEQILTEPTDENPSPIYGTGANGEIDTANWLTYRNEEYGFEFKYPEDALLTDRKNILLFGSSGQGDIISIKDPSISSPPEIYNIFIIRMADALVGENVEQTYQRLGDALPVSTSSVKLADRDAILYKQIPGMYPHDEILILDSGKLLTIQALGSRGEKILSTFKFID